MAAYTFASYDDVYIEMTINVTISKLIKKQYIKMRVSGDIMYLIYHDKERSNASFTKPIDYNDVTSPVVGSATALMAAIEAMRVVATSSGNSTVMNEVPSGAINGSNAVFTTADNYATGIIVNYNESGLGELIRLRKTVHYTESGANTITFITPPPASSEIFVDYIKA